MTTGVTYAFAGGARPDGRAARRQVHSPLIRRLTREAGLDPDRIVGTGPSGRVTKSDVARAKRHGPDPITDATRLRDAAVAVVEVDVTRSIQGALAGNPRLSMVAMVMHAIAGSWPGRQLTLLYDNCSGTEPLVIDGADDLGPAGFVRRLEGARPAEAREVGDGVRISVVDLGHLGLLMATAPPPEHVVAAVGVGVALERPVVVEGTDGERLIAMRSLTWISLSYDRAEMSVQSAAQLLGDIKRRVEAA